MNHIETVHLEDGVVSFNHKTGVMSAIWNNGYTETWSNHFGVNAHRNSFYRFTDQWEKVNED